jgi:hypothetical protein
MAPGVVQPSRVGKGFLGGPDAPVTEHFQEYVRRCGA